MSEPIKLGFDLDGVVADFNTSMLRLLQEIHGAPLGPCGDLRNLDNPCRHQPDRWMWFDQYGFPPHVLTQAQASVETPSVHFWRRLDPIHPYEQTYALLNTLTRARHVETYFLTTRPGPNARAQSEAWLQQHGAHKPTVLVTAHKGHVALALGLQYFIDDSIENMRNALGMAASCRVGFVEASYNGHWLDHVQGKLDGQNDPLVARVTPIRGLGGLVGFLLKAGILPRDFVLPTV